MIRKERTEVVSYTQDDSEMSIKLVSSWKESGEKHNLTISDEIGGESIFPSEKIGEIVFMMREFILNHGDEFPEPKQAESSS